MRDFLDQIEASLGANFYYVALLAALCVPDICGAIDSEDGFANGDKYAIWFDRFVAPRCFGVIAGTDAYRFRCSMIHQGSSQNPRNAYSRVLFVEPSATTNIFHCNVLNDALNIDVRVFCRDIIDGAHLWLREVENTERFRTNSDRFIRRYAQGLAPYIVGVPVIS